MNREKQEYLARAFGCGIHEGDTVRLMRAWTEEEGEHAGCYWEGPDEEYPEENPGMSIYIGKEGVVERVNDDSDYHVRFPDGELVAFPYFVLEKVEDR